MALSPSAGGSPTSTSSQSSTSSSSFGGVGPRWLRRCIPLLSEDYNPADLNQLQLASLRGDVNAVDALIRGGADVLCRSRGPQRLTALHLAAMGGHAEVADLLLSAGAAPVHKDGKGRMASCVAMARSNNAVMLPCRLTHLSQLLHGFGTPARRYWAHKGGHEDLATRLEPGNWMTPRPVGPPWRV